jgi:hypothetical protein
VLAKWPAHPILTDLMKTTIYEAPHCTLSPFTQLRVKVNLSPGLINYHTMKTYGDWRYGCTILYLGTKFRRLIVISVKLIIQMNSINS